MSLFQNFLELLQSIFMASSPEVKKRQALKKIEQELKLTQPCFYKNGMMQPSLAEVIKSLYVYTKELNDILSETVCNTDMLRRQKYVEQLLMTGFDDEAQEILESLTYSNRKSEAMEADSLMRFFESEHRELEKVVKQLNSQEFLKIDQVMDRLKQLQDISRFSYVSILTLFDINYSTMPGYVPVFQQIPPELLDSPLQDLYYVLADMDISKSLAAAIFALAQLYEGDGFTEQVQNKLSSDLKKVQSIIKNLLTKDTLRRLICLAHKDPEFEPKHATYGGNERQKYADYLENRFRVDEARLKTEIQDERLRSEINTVFAGYQLKPVKGYNADINNQLKQSTPASFPYVTPVQVLKSFVSYFYESGCRGMLNDIVIEGFFNNPAYKTEFSTVVFACNETIEHIKAFEALFDRNGRFDDTVLVGLISDSHKDNTFVNRLKDLVESANKEAKTLLQVETNNLNMLYRKLQEIVAESKKPTSDSINNLKILMMSSRNRDAGESLEKQVPLWQIFIEIMKNYVIIGSVEKKK